MKRVLKFQGRTGRYDVPSFLWTENDSLTIEFDIPENRVGRYVALFVCGTQEKTVKFNDKITVEFSAEWIKNSNYAPLFCYLEFRNVNEDRVLISSDPKLDGFFIEPLYIERLEKNATAIAWVQKVESEMQKMRETMETFAEHLKQFEGEGVHLTPIED